MNTANWNQLVSEIEAIEEMIAEARPSRDPDTAWALTLLETKLARKRSSLNTLFGNPSAA
jgi:hypothetical protein